MNGGSWEARKRGWAVPRTEDSGPKGELQVWLHLLSLNILFGSEITASKTQLEITSLRDPSHEKGKLFSLEPLSWALGTLIKNISKRTPSCSGQRNAGQRSEGEGIWGDLKGTPSSGSGIGKLK